LDSRLKNFPLSERALIRPPASLLTPECAAAVATASKTQKAPSMSWGSRLHTAWKTWQTHILALADQAVVSAASFLTTVVIARWTIPNELGLYSIGVSLLVSLLSIQESLISLPYTIQQHRAPGTSAEHAGSSLTHSALLSALGIVVLVVTALILSASGAEPQLRAMTWTLAGVLPFALLREFARKFSLAHLYTGQALILDSAVAAIQLAGLSWLGWTGRMSSATACAALGVACASTAIVWLCFSRGRFAIRWDQVLTTTRQSWGLGKWLFAGQITGTVQRYMPYWLLALVVGTTATGVFAACMSVVMFANPLITGINNIMTPRAVLALKEGGGALLRRQIIRDALLLGAATTLFSMVALFVADDVMRLLYPGKEYEGQGRAVAVLAVALLASAVGTPASIALASMERARAFVWASSVGAAVTGVLVWLLMVEWGLLGAAYGFLAGNVAGSVGRWVAFLTIVPQFGPNAGPMPIGSNSNSAMAIRVIQQFTQSSIDNGWVVEQLDEGVQAIVYAVTSQNQQPVWQAYHSLVIKLYKPSAAPNVEPVRGQLEALSRLHAVVNGRTINGWKISTPAPLYVCVSPLALVMTMVPGRPLTSLLYDADNMTPQVLDSVPRAIGSAMARCWSVGQLHGDLNFDNILCDIPNRGLSFVDLDLPTNSFLLGDDVPRRWYPASHDLAYMLYDTGMRVKSTMCRPGALVRRQMFTYGVLQAFIETINPIEEKQRALDEIEACARAHLRRLALSWSLRGLWYVLLKHIAARRVNAILLRLKAQLSHLDGTN
jgi:O-antigen/teichoic acid export membrane protein